VKAGAKAARHPSAIVEAARVAFQPGLELLQGQGADVNALGKHYRPLHTLMQAKPHSATPATAERLACLEWLLEHGANPEFSAGWPEAHAFLLAAFLGEAQYVNRLRRAVNADHFVPAALGDRRAVLR